MSKEYSEHIREQVMLFKDHLAEVHGIIMSEKKEIDWGIKYTIEVKGGKEQGVVVIYSDKKGVCSHRFQKKLENESKQIFIDAFENRYNLHNKLTQENSKNDDAQIIKLKYFYETLLPYRNEEFDFISFARVLSNDLPEEKLNDIRYDFSKIEKIYQNQLRGNG